MSDETKVTQEYGAEQIQVLEGLEAVRKRPGMYIGSTSSSGLHHLVYEIVDNAIDEALAGYCKHITVTINPGNSITVTDDGRGIPVDIQPQTGRPALEVVYTVLHAGGKFGGGGYKVSGGLHGVGASVVNALSEWLRVRVHKNGSIYEMKFARGNITQEMRIVGKTDKTGTEVTFQPDPEMFDSLVYDYEVLHERMREEAFLNAGLTITITDDRDDEKQISETMCYEGGIREFAIWCNRNKTPLCEDVIYMSGSKGDASAEIAVQYNDGYNEFLLSFANDVRTPEGGMHETGFKTALTRVLNAYGVKNGIIKGDDKVSGEDCREGITAIISVKLTDAQFEGQTKAKLGNAYIRTLVAQGEIERANEFLGHPYTLSDRVSHGKKLGTTLGFPTVNLKLKENVLSPAKGVYATKVILENGDTHLAVTNVGTRPTVDDGNQLTIEGFILDFHGDLYGQKIQMEFYKYLREERKFPSFEALTAEVMHNADQTREYFAQNP